MTNGPTGLYEAYEDWIIGIAQWLDVTDSGDNTSVYAMIPTFIRLAELELDKKLTLRRSMRFLTNTIDNDGILTLPDDFSRMKTCVLCVDGRTIDVVTPDYYHDALRLSGGSGNSSGFQNGRPSIYTIVGNNLQFMPFGQDLDIQISYYRLAEPLSDSVPNNIYSNYAPECLLSAAIMYGAKALFDEDRMALWAKKLDEEVATRNTESEEAELGSSPLVMRVPLQKRLGGYR